jgi:hypothetical protein
MFTYINVWRDGKPLLAYEVPEDKSLTHVPPMVVKPEERGLPAYPNDGWPWRDQRTWGGVARCLAAWQADPRYTINESCTAWDAEHGWPVPQVKP